ncbi:putative steroid dehydrogenase [Hypoxylon sp. FL0890]|nr:putative steroid dehydrogenase [Hypoxylon sp. FL0890]
MSLSAIWTQCFPPRNGAPLTEANLPNQSGCVFIVTGGSSGLGYQLARILYAAGGKVYVLTRSKENADDAISRTKADYDSNRDDQTRTRGATGERDVVATPGSLEFIPMDLADLTTVKAAAREFLKREERLDILFNNAATGARRNAPLTLQGHEHHIGIKSLGPYLLTQLLMPILSDTAKISPKDSVRVVWAASLLVEMTSPKDGIRKDFLQNGKSVKDENELYASSKAANWFLASEFAHRNSGLGVIHIAGNPGNYVTGIWRHVPRRDPVHGAETYPWMAFSDSVTMDEAVTGRYAICDGRWHPGQRQDLFLALKSGGSGRAKEYFDWCERRVEEFVH